MKKVFIVCEKYFFLMNGYDYAAAINDDKIVCFKNREDAVEHMKRETEKLRDIHGESVVKVERSKGGGYNQVRLNDGCRYVVQIIEKNLL